MNYLVSAIIVIWLVAALFLLFALLVFTKNFKQSKQYEKIFFDSLKNESEEKAIKKGLISPNKILSNQDAYNLIFLPGFSTSDKISSVSGRGVGLDVVKTMVEKLKGTINVTSERGKGSKFSIRLPLTLAIIQGLLVRVGKEVYSIPVANVIESQRVKLDTINTALLSLLVLRKRKSALWLMLLLAKRTL